VATDTDNGAPIPEEVRAFFDNSLRIGYMATVRSDASLSVVPVGIMIHDGELRISSPTATKKVRNLRSNPHVTVCVTDPTDSTHYLTIRGTAELTDDTDRAFVDWMARTHMGRDEYPYEPRRVARTIITIRPDRFVMPKVHGSDR